MQTVRLGRTELEISRIGMGGIPIQRPTADEATRIIHHALDAGITFFDTANGYGESEARFGEAFASRPGSRELIVIATRTGARDAKTAEKHLALSLERLQTDYLDLWQFHNVSSEEAYEQVLGPGGAIEVARRALEAGTIRHLGITSHSMGISKRAVASGRFEMILFPFNFVNDEAEKELVPLCRAHDVGFVAMKPFAGGRLNDAGLAFRYLLQFEDVVAIPGIERAQEIDEILEVERSGMGLDEQDARRIEAIRAELGNKFCQWCGYCLPACPQAIQIPMVINVSVMTKLWPESFWPRLADPVETARTCLECAACESKCPYGLPIREMLVRGIAAYAEVVS